MRTALGYPWACHHFLVVYMANISNYDAKVYFWGMVLFATVSFIALPITAFIYFDNRVLKSEIAAEIRELKKLKRELKSTEKEE